MLQPQDQHRTHHHRLPFLTPASASHLMLIQNYNFVTFTAPQPVHQTPARPIAKDPTIMVSDAENPLPSNFPAHHYAITGIPLHHFFRCHAWSLMQRYPPCPPRCLPILQSSGNATVDVGHCRTAKAYPASHALASSQFLRKHFP